MRMKGKKVIYSYEDTFSMFNILRPVIYEGVKKFRDTLKSRNEAGKVWSYPRFISEGVNEEDWPDYWLNVLDQIVEGFSYDFYKVSRLDDEKYEKMTNAIDLFGKYFYHLWW